MHTVRRAICGLFLFALIAAPVFAQVRKPGFPYVDCPYFCVNYSNDNAECNAEGTIKRQSHMSSCTVRVDCMNTEMGQMCDAYCVGTECYYV